MCHLPCSPDLACADFWLFPKLKKMLRGIRFPDLNTLEYETDCLLGLIPSHEYKHALTAQDLATPQEALCQAQRSLY